jgi:hypothetical protein
MSDNYSLSGKNARYEVGDCESCEAHFHNRYHELMTVNRQDLEWFWAMGIQ